MSDYGTFIVGFTLVDLANPIDLITHTPIIDKSNLRIKDKEMSLKYSKKHTIYANIVGDGMSPSICAKY